MPKTKEISYVERTHKVAEQFKRGFNLHEIPYGWLIEDFENSFVIQLTTRQDGKCSILVTMTSIDDEAKVLGTGLVKSNDKDVTTFINDALYKGMCAAKWIQPIKNLFPTGTFDKMMNS